MGDLLQVWSGGENSTRPDEAEYLECQGEKGREVDQAKRTQEQPPRDQAIRKPLLE
jgi:hypothetical protein